MKKTWWWWLLVRSKGGVNLWLVECDWRRYERGSIKEADNVVFDSLEMKRMKRKGSHFSLDNHVHHTSCHEGVWKRIQGLKLRKASQMRKLRMFHHPFHHF